METPSASPRPLPGGLDFGPAAGASPISAGPPVSRRRRLRPIAAAHRRAPPRPPAAAELAAKVSS